LSNTGQQSHIDRLLPKCQGGRKESSYAGLLIKEKPIQLAKTAHQQRRPKLQPSRKGNQKVNKVGHLRQPSTAYLLIQVARASTSVIATQQSRWIEFMTRYFPMGYFCKDFSYL